MSHASSSAAKSASCRIIIIASVWLRNPENLLLQGRQTNGSISSNARRRSSPRPRVAGATTALHGSAATALAQTELGWLPLRKTETAKPSSQSILSCKQIGPRRSEFHKHACCFHSFRAPLALAPAVLAISKCKESQRSKPEYGFRINLYVRQATRFGDDKESRTRCSAPRLVPSWRS